MQHQVFHEQVREGETWLKPLQSPVRPNAKGPAHQGPAPYQKMFAKNLDEKLCAVG